MKIEDDDGEPTTRTLLNRGRQGDAGALDRVFARIGAAVQRWAHGRLPRRSRSTTDTRDVVQDAAAGVLRRLDKLDLKKRGDLEAYLRQAVRNRILDEARRLQTRPEVTTADSAIPDNVPSPLQDLMEREIWLKYRVALAAMDEADRQAIIARFEMGYSHEEIAVLLRKPSAAAARMAVNRALARLKQIAAGHDSKDPGR